MKPFKRKVWWSNEAKDYWSDKFRKAERLFHRLELESVKQGHRKVCTRHYDPKSLPDKRGQLIDDGLVFLPIQRVGSYSGFAHSHPQPEPGDWNYYGVIGRSEEDCRKFQVASKEGDHKKIGDLLGYPPKSQDFFQEFFVEKEHPDPIWDIKGKTKEDNEYIAKPSYYTNIALRYFGFRLIPFFPHSWGSDKATEFGEKFENVAKQVDDPEVHAGLESMQEILKMPYIWDSLHGVVQVYTPLFQGMANTGYQSEKKRIIFLPKDMKIPEKGRIPRDLIPYV